LANERLHEFTAVASADMLEFGPFVSQSPGAHDDNASRRIVLDASDMQYRLLQETNGYLVGLPATKQAKAKYGLESIPIKDACLAMFALHRNDPPKIDLVDEFIHICKSITT
jgi:hypothetical protein